MEPQLILLRLETQCQSSSSSFSAINYPCGYEGNYFTSVAKWDINHAFHLAMLYKKGILQTYTLETSVEKSNAYLYPCGSFQLHIDFGPLDLQHEFEGLQTHNINNGHSKNNNDGLASWCLGHDRRWNEKPTRTRPVEKTWGSFEFIHQRRSEIVFFQDGSRRILLAKFPGGSPRVASGGKSLENIDSKKSKVYCVGRHSSTILSIAVRGDGQVLVSAARDGQLRIWRIFDGSMLAQNMFSRCRQPRSPHSPREEKCTNSLFQNDSIKVEMDQLTTIMPILSFLGKSQDFCMACPNGELRIWNLMERENSQVKIEEVENVVAKNVMVGKDRICALALHVPDCNFPMQHSKGDTQSCSHSQEAFIAIGSMKKKLQVWNKHTMLSVWVPLWSTTLLIEGASIVSLSFRADGELLAVAASRFSKPIALNPFSKSCHSLPNRSKKKPCDFLYLYSTSSWECIRWLSFSSNLGSCFFYQPHFQEEDKNESNTSTSQDKVWSCRLLLVSTSDGPQAHILPEFGLFKIQAQFELNEIENLNCRKDTRNVHWADKKGKLSFNGSCSYKKEIQQEYEDRGEDEGDGGGSCDTNPMATKTSFYKNDSECLLAMEVDNGEIPSKDNNKRQKVDEKIGLQDLRNITFQKCEACSQSHHLQKIKTKMHMSKDASKGKISKQRRVHEESIERRGHEIAKNQNYKKQSLLEVVTKSCKNCKLKTLNVGFENYIHNSSCSHSPFSLNPSPLEKDGQDNGLGDQNIENMKESCCRMPMDTLAPVSAFPHQNMKDRLNIKTQKEVNFINPKDSRVIPNLSRERSFCSKPTISHSRKKGGKEHLGILTIRKSSCSKIHHVNNSHEKTPSTQHKTIKTKGWELQSHILGGVELHELLAMNEESSPFKDMVCMGGTFCEIAPSTMPLGIEAIAMDPSKTSQEGKPSLELKRPMACSTATLMQRLQEIEHETFNLESALQVAKTKGIFLSKNDRQEIKVALEEEMKEGSSKYEHDVEGRKSSARYIPLLKISNAQIACTGPFVAPRKVKKQTFVKGEDLSSIQPALFDLWDLHERCPQVSSTNLEQANTFTASSWRMALGDLDETNKNSLWVQREDLCRAAASAQAIYDNCLHRPDLEHQCHCYKRDQGGFNVR